MAVSKSVLAKVVKIKDHYGEVAEALVQFEMALEEDDEDRVDTALDGIPTASRLTKMAEDLGELLEQEPWKKKGKK